MTKPTGTELEQAVIRRDRLSQSLNSKRADHDNLQRDIKKNEESISALIRTGLAKKIEEADHVRRKLTGLHDEAAHCQGTIALLEEEITACDQRIAVLRHDEEREALARMFDDIRKSQDSLLLIVLNTLRNAQRRFHEINTQVGDFQSRHQKLTKSHRPEMGTLRAMKAFDYVFKMALPVLTKLEQEQGPPTKASGK